MRRLGVIVALCTMLGTLAGVVTASPALAGRGPKWELVNAGPFTLPAAFCGFRIHVTFPVAREYFKVLRTADGSMTTLFTGSLKSTFTNLSNGKAVTENVGGPGKLINHPDGSVTVEGRGHGGLFLPPADAQRFGLPGVSVLTGHLTQQIDSAGHRTSLSLHGHVLVNVCAALS